MTHPVITTLDRVAALRAAWPDYLQFSRPDLPETAPQLPSGAPNIYGYHPYLFAGAFPGVDEHQLADLSVAAYLFSNMIFEVDSAVDQDQTTPWRGPLDMLAGQFEAYRALARLFPGERPLWDVLRARMLDYATVVRQQRRFVSGERAIIDFSYPDTVDWARAKASLATVTVAALGELAGTTELVRAELVQALTRSVHAYSVATQLLDDVVDWRADLAGRRPSYPLARAMTVAGQGEPEGEHWSAEQVDRIGRALYFEGVIASMMDLVTDQIAEAQAAASDLGADEWLDHLEYVAGTARTLRAQVPDEISSAGPGPRRPALSVRITVDRRRPWQLLAYQSLRWLLGQWQLGFPDANHVMAFPGMPNPGPHIGDVFSRALIANVLVEVNRGVANGQLAPCLATEVDHLLDRRRTGEPGLWAYFPELADLACDADDLAEGLRLLTHTGRADALSPELAAALAVAFDDARLPDGSFGTWLIPRVKGEWAARQSAAARELWGEGADPEVVANLLHAVAEYAPQRYREALDRGVGYLFDVQSAEGWWSSGWYRGWLYGTYQCMRTITLLRPDAVEALGRAQDRVLASQREDGGWANTGEASDPLGTALALLALAQAQKCGLGGAADRDAAIRPARQWLADNAGTDGSYPEESFIVMSPRRSLGLGHELGFGCRSITTAMVCLATLTWDRLS